MSEKKTSNRKKISRVIGALLGGVLIYAVIAQTDVDSLMAQMGQIGPWFFLVIAVTFSAYFTVVIAWHQSFLNPLPWNTLFQLFNIRLIGESLAQINPTNVIAGETLKGILLKDRLRVNYLDGAVSLLLSRIMIILSSGILFTFGVVIMFQHLNFGNLQAISIIICSLIILAFFYFIHALKIKKGVLASLSKLMKKLFRRFETMQRAADSLLEIDADLITFYHKKKANFYLVFFLSLFHRIVGSMEYYVIFYALGIDVSFLSCILFDLSSMIFRSAGFFIPGQLGLEEFGNKIMFSLVNIPGSETWVTASLVRRGRQLFWIFAGFVVYLMLSRDIKKELKEVDTVEG